MQNNNGYNTVKPFVTGDNFFKKDNEKLKAELQKKDMVIKELQNEIDNLKYELEQNKRIHNERGAGRKSKITEEMAQEVIRLWRSGLSFSEIANIYTNETGIFISKSTVDKITKTYIFDEE